jgi:hypothetical protein
MDEVKPKRRRPTSEDFEPLCRMMAEGKSLRAACEVLGLDAPSASKAMRSDRGLRQQYVHAREDRGDFYGEKVAVVADGVLAGEIKPEAGRVAMDGYKWTAARMHPNGWGDKQTLEHTGPGGGPIQHKDMTPAQRRQRIEELQNRMHRDGNGGA